jgi:NADPH2:quinone reductase
MRAVVLDAVPAPPEALVIRERPVPQPERGWVLIEVKAFGLNRSELKTRLGFTDPDVTLPRVPGIEATGSSRPAQAASWPSASRWSR